MQLSFQGSYYCGYCAEGYSGILHCIDLTVNLFNLLALNSKSVFLSISGDGSCFFINELCNTTTELTGSDCDHIYKVVCDNSHVYTACRDGLIRKYSFANI
jgi:proteasomal ATPase-associated factor 1